jgi:formate dehydrogenase subunit beta
MPEGALVALRKLLADLLGRGLVDALLVQRPGPGGDSLVHALLDRAEELASADPIAPVMPVQGARLVSTLTAGRAPYRLGVVLKPCELRATIELAKLKQVDLTGVLLLGVDCLGTYEVSDYAALVAAGQDPTVHALANAAAGTVAPMLGGEFRAACTICEQPVAPPPGAGGGAPAGPAAGEPVSGEPAVQSLTLGTLGLGGSVLVAGSEELVGALGYATTGVPAAREQAVAALVAERTAARDRELAAWKERVHDAGALLAEFSRCIRCHNCMANCPLCYCKECVFRGATFDHSAGQYHAWLQRRNALRLPADTLLFHLTRLNHMVASCVGCGACSSACPSHLPVATMFRVVGQGVQALFGYVPGRSLDDELPLAVFREDELEDVTR